MFVKNSICALQILEKAIACLCVTHIAQISTDCLICGNLLGKKTFAKEKYIIQLNSVLFINITKDLQYTSRDKHEMLSSYEYGFQEKY